MSIDQAIKAINGFQGESLTQSLSAIESSVIGLSLIELQKFCGNRGIDNTFLASALSIKKIAGQINVIIHAAGILHSLLSVLEPGEVVESVSLGAGNTGRKFDLETNLRVAEYKFIDWQGGPESIRQNGVFKDFFELAEYETTKKKYLYVVGTDFPLRFFRGGRALTSVLSRQPAILARIAAKYGASIVRVCDYYVLKKDEVQICDISPHIGRDV
jgi:hypothetical protein